MFAVHDVNELPRDVDPVTRFAVTVAFAATATVGGPGQAPPLHLMRLVRHTDTGRLAVIGHHLDGTGITEAIADLTPTRCGVHPRESHLGAIVATELRTGTGAAPSAEGRESFRLLVGATVTGWSLAIQQSWDDAVPQCSVAPPSEFGSLAADVTKALASFNQTFGLG